MTSDVQHSVSKARVDENHNKVFEIDEVVKRVLSLSIDPEPVRKHTLQQAWTLWFFSNDKALSWQENQNQIISMSSVEDFWGVYNHLELASRLPTGSDYSLFKVFCC